MEGWLLEFIKMHGLGNDYVFLDGLAAPVPSEARLPALAQELADRHFGVGGDGLILILPPQGDGDFRMRIFNADGSEGEMCGNGIRCLARYVYEQSYTDSTSFAVETGAGLIRPQLLLEDGRVQQVRVNMGRPRLAPAEIPAAGFAGPRIVEQPLAVDGQELSITCVSMGNPHCVLFVADVKEAPVHQLGPRLEHHEAFPERTNVEFVSVTGPGRLAMRVWERGSGETLACGTGACASLVAAHLAGHSPRAATLELLGGALEIVWGEDDFVYMTGPATIAFTGTWQGS